MRTAFLLLCLVCLTGALLLPARAQAPADSVYTVRPGDTLYGISREVGIPVPTLQAWNDLEGTTLQAGEILRLRPPSTLSPDAVEPAPLGTWVVRPGDTFVEVALRLGTTADTLFALNDSTTASLPPSQPLRLPARFAPPTHVVQPGETLYGIAGQYGVSLRALRQANALDTTALRPGQRVRIPGRTGARPASPGMAAPDTTGPVVRYPSPFAGRLTASGAAYDPETYVGSHPSLPYGSVVLLSRPDADAHMFVRIVDRGPLDDSLLMDVSAAVARGLQLPSDARNQPVELRVVWVEDAATR
jgi:LysM repeat protein